MAGYLPFDELDLTTLYSKAWTLRMESSWFLCCIYTFGSIDPSYTWSFSFWDALVPIQDNLATDDFSDVTLCASIKNIRLIWHGSLSWHFVFPFWSADWACWLFISILVLHGGKIINQANIGPKSPKCMFFLSNSSCVSQEVFCLVTEGSRFAFYFILFECIVSLY